MGGKSWRAESLRGEPIHSQCDGKTWPQKLKNPRHSGITPGPVCRFKPPRCAQGNRKPHAVIREVETEAETEAETDSTPLRDSPVAHGHSSTPASQWAGWLVGWMEGWMGGRMLLEG